MSASAADLIGAAAASGREPCGAGLQPSPPPFRREFLRAARRSLPLRPGINDFSAHTAKVLDITGGDNQAVYEGCGGDQPVISRRHVGYGNSRPCRHDRLI